MECHSITSSRPPIKDIGRQKPGCLGRSVRRPLEVTLNTGELCGFLALALGPPFPYPRCRSVITHQHSSSPMTDAKHHAGLDRPKSPGPELRGRGNRMGGDSRWDMTLASGNAVTQNMQVPTEGAPQLPRVACGPGSWRSEVPVPAIRVSHPNIRLWLCFI